MKTHRLGKKENSRKVTEAKESEGKLEKVPTEETTKAKTLNDLDLAIAEMVYNRQPYHLIAKRLKVSPKTISKVTKKMTEGAIKIGADGKAICSRNAELMEIGPFPTQLQMEIFGAAHLEGKSPLDVIARLVRVDRKRRLNGLNLEQFERAAEFVEKTYSRGWTIDQLIDIITRLKNSGLLDLNQQSMGLLSDFLECIRRRNLKPEHVIRIFQRTEDEWKRLIQEGQEIGYKQGIEHHADWLMELAGKYYKDLGLLASLCSLVDLAKRMAMRDIQS